MINDPYVLRARVARWLRIRAEQLEDSVGIKGHAAQHVPSNAAAHAILTQLAADAEHSDLLVRLFLGEEPLPFNEWRAKR